jgi:hypothetical protein
MPDVKPLVQENSEERLSKAYGKFEKLFSSSKARECIKKVETELAFDREVFLQPIRDELADCIEIISSMVRERGTDSDSIQKLIPVLSKWMDPGAKLAQDIARLEQQINEKKRENPDIQKALKLQLLVNRHEEILKNGNLNPFEYDRTLKECDRYKKMLAEQVRTKVRIAQKAFAPDLLELAQSQLELTRHQEKILRIKEELLKASQKNTKSILQNLAKIFEDVEPELSDSIIQQTNALISTGNALNSPLEKKFPSNLNQFKAAIDEQHERIERFDQQLNECKEQLQTLLEFEEAIFNTYGEQLRARGLQFKKPTKVAKTGVGIGAKTQPASRMVNRRE